MISGKRIGWEILVDLICELAEIKLLVYVKSSQSFDKGLLEFFKIALGLNDVGTERLLCYKTEYSYVTMW